jgi:malonyl CoA-acyl carrier protein transacylase/acyl carrier protein
MDKKNRSLTAFLFPGQGSIGNSTLSDLFNDFPGFQADIEVAQSIVRKHFSKDLSSYIYPGGPESKKALVENDFEISQCLIFLASYFSYSCALQKGLKPDVLLGHSVGEVAAMVAAGCFSLQTGLQIICLRTEAIQQSTKEGKMLALQCEATRLRGLLAFFNDLQLEMGITNAPRQCVVSGSDSDIYKFRERTSELGVMSTLLQSKYPFHSQSMLGAVSAFYEKLRSFHFQKPETPLFSPIALRFYKDDDNLFEHLAFHLVRPLDFTDGIFSLYRHGVRSFFEMGDRGALTHLTKNILADFSDFRALSARPKGSSFLAGINAMAGEFENKINLAPSTKPNIIPHPVQSPVPAPVALPAGRTLAVASDSGVVPVVTKVPDSAPPEFTQKIWAVYKEITNYPDDVLELGADLESELGLDSVKQVEILARLARELGLEPRQDTAVSVINTIQKVAAYFYHEINRSQSQTVSPPPIPIIIPQEILPASDVPADFIKIVWNVYKEITNYPDDVLELDVDLESDLGLDSVKQVEILARLSGQFGMQPRSDLTVSQVNTIRKVATFLHGEVSRNDSTGKAVA